ncbi:MAG TPA: succinyl-diaminopimelate desuccinylase, partial [Candidatus Limnocylindria bacterium]
MTTEATERIRTAATALRPECEAFLQELVRIPTVNPPGDRYEDCARVIGDRLAALGYAVQY